VSKILYSGWYDHGNVGDEQYKTSFPALFPGHDNRFVRQLNAADVNWSDEVVVGGGNIVNAHFLEQIDRYIPPTKPVSLFSVGATDVPIDNPARFARFKKIWVRDQLSRNRLAAIGVPSDCVPDSSWVLTPDIDHGDRLWRDLFVSQNKDLYSKRVVVVLNAHLTSKQPDLLARDALRWQVFADDMVSVIDGTSASFAFLPFGRHMPWDDRVPGSWVAHKCKWHKKNAVVWDEWSVQDSLDFIAAADATVSMRFHSTVFSCIAGVPLIDITHHDKNKSFLESVGLQDYGVSYWDFPREKVHDLLGMILRGYLRDFFSCVGLGQRQKVLDYAGTVRF
jgi:hypothetical protein